MNTIMQSAAERAIPGDANSHEAAPHCHLGVEAAVAAIVETVQAAEPAARPFWQTEPCPTWCTNTHQDRDFFGDRNHWASGTDIDLSLYRVDCGQGESGPATVTVSATQHYRNAEPEVDLTVPTSKPGHLYEVAGEQGVRLSVAEACALRDALSELLANIAKQARQ